MVHAPVVLATSGYDHSIRFWEAPSGICYRTIAHQDSQVNRLEITPDKMYLAAAGHPHIRLYEINGNDPNPVSSYDGHTNNVTAVGFQKDGRWMFTGSEDKTIKIWDMRAPGYQVEFQHHAPINTVALHPNQGELISADQDGNIRAWDLQKIACSRELVPDGDVSIRSISVAPDASLVVAANDKGRCFVWRLNKPDSQATTFDPLVRLEAHNTYVLKCVISPDARYLATASADHTIKLWDCKNDFAPDKTLSGHQRWVWDCAFSADSAYLVSGSSDHVARLWDLARGETIRHYAGHTKACVALALNDSPDTPAGTATTST